MIGKEILSRHSFSACLIFILIFWTNISLADVFYIDPSRGRDSSTCGQSKNQACASWKYLNQRYTPHGGDTLCLLNPDGKTHLQENIIIEARNSGSSTKPFIVDGRCGNQAHRGIIDGSKNSKSQGLVELLGTAFVELHDLEIRNHPGRNRQGIKIAQGSHDIRILRPKIHNIGTSGASSIGIAIGIQHNDGGYNHVIEGTPATDRWNPDSYDCQIHNAYWNGLKIENNNIKRGASFFRHCAVWDVQGDVRNADSIQGAKYARNWTFSDNLISNGPGGEDAMDLGWGSNSDKCVKEPGSGQYGHVIERNIFTDLKARQGGSVTRSYLVLNGCAENITVRNNIFYGAARAIQFYAAPKNIKLYNNTIYVEQEAIRFWQTIDGFELVNNIIVGCVNRPCRNFNRVIHVDAQTRKCSQQKGHSRWQNNIIAAHGKEDRLITMDITGGAFVPGGCVSSKPSAKQKQYTESQKEAWEQANWLGKAAYSKDRSWGHVPHFANIKAHDFNLTQSDTVARDQGYQLSAVKVDFMGNVRGSSPDIGALEWQGSSPDQGPQAKLTPPMLLRVLKH